MQRVQELRSVALIAGGAGAGGSITERPSTGPDTERPGAGGSIAERSNKRKGFEPGFGKVVELEME